MNKKLSLSFDIGHNSIGWAVLSSDKPVTIRGCGVVTFQADDCLASQRRGFRRQRRHTLSVRNRIKRLKQLFLHLGVLTAEQLEANDCAWPWLLAAKVLKSEGKETLTWPELWSVLRWYAHNRGYDGNVLWSGDGADGEEITEEEKQDTEKVKKAHSLMKEHETRTMAETICAVLGADPLNGPKASRVYFKGNDAAFPRGDVVKEVRRVLQAHFGKLPKCDEALEKALCDDWQAIPCPELNLPKRFGKPNHKGLLFGQYIPRFDNRIIPPCPITGKKTPLRDCPEFYRYRWARLLNNFSVNDPSAKEGTRKLTAEERQKLHQRAETKGYFTKKCLTEAVQEVTGREPANFDSFFMTVEMEKALVLDPVKKALHSEKLKNLWPLLPEKYQKIFSAKMRKGKRLSLDAIRKHLQADGVATEEIETQLREQYDKKPKKQKEKTSFEHYLAKPIHIEERASGRAPYCRELLVKTFEEVMAGKDPTGPDGCLYESEEVRNRRMEKDLAELTNNHLVRHRLLIFERLLDDIVKNYASGDRSRVSQVTIEVVRDLQEFSGKTVQETAKLLGIKFSHHRKTAKQLESELSRAGVSAAISAGLIRKARVLDDLDWTCPYTGQKLSFDDLINDRLQVEHIIPRSLRPSDSLDSFVMTFREVNEFKGQRTAMEFIAQEQGKKIPGRPTLEVMTMERYRKFVFKLKPHGPSQDDKRRWRNRKHLLLTDSYKPREGEFVGRDLTVTSYINKLAALKAKNYFKELSQPAKVIHLPGSVTGTVRKSWAVLGCIGKACPLVLDAEGNAKIKSDIREITHLHHALDAVVQGLASTYIPADGKLWELMGRKSLRDNDRRDMELRGRGAFRFNHEGKWELADLPAELKNQLADRLAEKRVIQHIPARMRGLKVQQNTWRVVGLNDKGKMILEQYSARDKDGKRQKKQSGENPNKLLGLSPKDGDGKLEKLQGALVIDTNYGVALDPEPEVIRFFKVYPKLRELKEKNGGKWPRVLRNGMIIKVPKGCYQGTWMIRSVKEGGKVNMTFPDVVKVESKGFGIKRDVALKTLLKDGFTILKHGYTGVGQCPTTSST